MKSEPARLIALGADASPADHEERLWQAVLARDASCDGQFVFGVRSTGIYCRPSCGARRPRRDRVAFFSTSFDAEREGFRACRRCTPPLFDDAMAKRRLDAELRVAAALHQRLQPAPLTGLAGWDVAAACVPCREVGGDYVDFFRRDADGRLIVVLGDVAGKGIGAALLMSSLHAAVHAQASTGAPPDVVLAELNRYLYASTPAEAYATLFYAEIDVATGRMASACAGHNAPMLRSPGAALQRLDTGGIPIGLMPQAPYERQESTLAEGAVLVAYSDGITECSNPEGEEFGEARLAELVAALPHEGAAGARDHVRDAVRRFARGSVAKDDASILVATRLASGR